MLFHPFIHSFIHTKVCLYLLKFFFIFDNVCFFLCNVIRLQETAIPTVTIAGPRIVEMRSSQPVSLLAESSIPRCAGLSGTDLTYSWTVYQGDDLLPSVVSLAVEPRRFKLEPYTFSPLNVYTVQVLVEANVEGRRVFSTATVQLQIKLGDVYTVIDGGLFRQLNLLSSIILDGGSSYSEDDPFNPSALSYTWSCTDVSEEHFGDPCHPSVNIQNVARFTANLAHYVQSGQSRALQFSLTAKNLKGVSNTAVTTITMDNDANIPVVSLSPVAAKYDASKKIIVTGLIFAERAATLSWSLQAELGMGANEIFLTPVDEGIPAGVVLFQQAISRGLLTPGMSYSLRLAASYTDVLSESSFADIELVMNEPPTGGELLVTPSEGTELLTEFLLLTYSWEDDVADLPLSYSLHYYTLVTSPTKLLKASGPEMSTTTLLRAGLASQSFTVTCSATARDRFGAAASATYDAQVTGSELSNAELSIQLNTLLNVAAVEENPEAASQVLSAVAGIINAVNCTSAVSTYCDSLSRNPCSTTAGTCGSCKAGFSGVEGDANLICVLDLAALRSVGEACTQDEDCTSTFCDFGLCVDPPKQCPNSCSGRGECIATNYTGSYISNCTVSNPYCSVDCLCNEGWFGAACGLSAADFDQYVEMRGTMCSELFALSVSQDVTEDVVRDRAILVAELMSDPTQVSSDALANCTLALTNTIIENRALAGRQDVSSLCFDGLSALLRVRGLPQLLLAQLDLAYVALAEGIREDVAIGEQPTSFNSGSLRFSTSLVGANNTNYLSVSTSIPQSDLEVLNGLTPTTVDLSFSEGLVPQDGAVGLTLFQYNKDFLGGSASSSGIGFQSSAYSVSSSFVPSTDARRRRLQPASSGDASNRTAPGITFVVTFPNIAPVDYFETVPETGIVDCLRTGEAYTITRSCSGDIEYEFHCPGDYGQQLDYTCPKYTMTAFCSSWDGAQYLPEDSCEVVDFNSTYTTCACFTGSQNQTESSSTSARIRHSRRLADAADSDLIQIAGNSEVVVTKFRSSVIHDGDRGDPSVERNLVVLIVSGFVVLLFVVVLLILLYYDHKHAKAKQHKYKTGKSSKSLDCMGKSSAVLVLNPSHPLHDHIAVATPMGLVGDSATGAATDHLANRKTRTLAIDSFFNALLPKELTGLPWYTRLGMKFSAEHDWYSILGRQVHYHHHPLHRSSQQRRHAPRDSWAHTSDTHHELKSLRWILAMGRLINFLFFTTLFVGLYFADDGYCEAQHTESDCLQRKSIFGLSDMCNWEPKIDTSCTFNKLSIDNPMAILAVAIIVTIVALPFDHLFYFVVVKIKLSSSDVGTASARSASNKVQKQVEPKVQRGAGHRTRKHQLQVQGAGAQRSKNGHYNPNALYAGTYQYAKQHELRGIMPRQALYLRAARLVLLQTKTDRISTRKEITTLLNDIHLGEAVLAVERSQMHTISTRIHRLNVCLSLAVRRCFRYLTGSGVGAGAAGAAKYRDNLDEDTIAYVTTNVRYSRRHAKDIKKTMTALASDIDREAYLVQQFLVESLPPLQRQFASFYLFRKAEISKLQMANWVVYTMFAVLMLYIAFCVVYIFVFGLRIGARASLQWLLVIAICFVHDLAILQPIKIWMKWVAVASVASAELRVLHALLRERCRFILTRRNGVVRNFNEMVQHFNPACRAARAFPELAASRLLISLNDGDLPLSVYKDSGQGFGRVAISALYSFLLIVLSPLLLLPQISHEFFVELSTTVLINAAVVALIFAGRFNILIPIGFVAAIVLLIILTILFIRRAEAKKRATVLASLITEAERQRKDDEDEFDQRPDQGIGELETNFMGGDEKAATSTLDSAELQRFEEQEEFTVYTNRRHRMSMKMHMKKKEDNYAAMIKRFLFGDEPESESDEGGDAAVAPAAALAGESEAEKIDLSKHSPQGKAPLTPKRDSHRIIPRHVRREQERSLQVLVHEQEQMDLDAAADEEFNFSYGALYGDDSDSDQEQYFYQYESDENGFPVRHLQRRSPRKRPPSAAREPVHPPGYDFAAAVEKVLAMDVAKATTSRRPVARPAPEQVRVSRELRRQKLMEQRALEEEEQKHQDEDFSIDFDTRAERDVDGNPDVPAPRPTTTGHVPAAASAVSSVMVLNQLNRNLRTMRMNSRRRAREEKERAEALQEPDEDDDFDFADMFYDGEGEGAAEDGASSGKVGDAQVASADEKRRQQLAKKDSFRPGSSSQFGSSRRSRSKLERATSAGSSDSRARSLAMAAATRRERLAMVNNYVQSRKLSGRRDGPLTPQSTSQAQAQAQTGLGSSGSFVLTCGSASGGAAVEGSVGGAGTGSSYMLSPPRGMGRRRETHRFKAEERARQQKEAEQDWEMMNDDLFEEVISDIDDEDEDNDDDGN